MYSTPSQLLAMQPSASSASIVTTSQQTEVSPFVGPIIFGAPVTIAIILWLYKYQKRASQQRKIARLERLWALRCERSL
jgi:hypothetical protein